MFPRLAPMSSPIRAHFPVTAYVCFLLAVAVASGESDTSSLSPVASPIDQLVSLISEENNFHLSARVTIFKSPLNVSAEILLNEYYSNTKRKAKLEIHKQQFGRTKSSQRQAKLSHKISYYYDTRNNGTLIRFATTSDNARPSAQCKAVAGSSQLARDLFQLDGQVDAFNWLSNGVSGEQDGKWQHFIGLTRLLLLVDRANNQAKLEGYTRIRNHRVAKWVFHCELNTNAGPPIKLIVYLSSATPAGQQDLDASGKNAMPIRIFLELPAGVRVALDVHSMGAIPSDHQFQLSEGARPTGNGQVELFTLPLGLGCGDLLAPPYAYKMRYQMDTQKVVSFRMDLYEIGELQMFKLLAHSFVAYDGYSGAARWDTLKLTTSSLANGSLDYVTIIFDLSARRKFYIKQQALATELGSWNSMRVFKERNTSGARLVGTGAECVATEAENYGAQMGANQFEPIIPFDKLVEMGTALVRGVETRVFEHSASRLPDLIFHQTTFVDSSGNKVSKSDLIALINEQSATFNDTNAAAAAAGDKFVITYFILFDENAQQTNQPPNDYGSSFTSASAQLMRLDVRWKESLFVRVEIYDFIWQLTDAPDGDRQDELFALRDRCSHSATTNNNNNNNLQQTTTDHHHQQQQQQQQQSVPVSLQLVYVESAPVSQLTRDDLHQFVESAAIRNKALIRGLSASWRAITATEIHQVRSRVHYDQQQQQANSNNNNSTRIIASLQLAHAKPKLYNPISIGRGWLSSGQLEPENQLANTNLFSDCLWEAARLQQSLANNNRHLLVSYCRSTCIVDREARLEFSGQVDLFSKKSNKPPRLLESRVFQLVVAVAVEDSRQAGDLCEIFHFEVAEDEPRSNQEIELKSWRSIYFNLKNKLITLPMVDLATNSRASQLANSSDEQRRPQAASPLASYRPAIKSAFFRVERLELDYDKWRRPHRAAAVDQTDEGDQLLAALIDGHPLRGVGLVAGGGGGASKPSGDYKLIRDVDLSLQFHSKPSETMMSNRINVEQCHDECVADIDCRSYSICQLRNNFHCLLSGIELRNSGLLAQIKSKMSGAGSGTFELLISDNDSTANDSTSDENAPSSKQLRAQFKIDPRCRLHARRALELFRRLPRSSEIVVDRNLVAVSDVEECASLCLRKSNNYFRRIRQSKSRAALKNGTTSNLNAEINAPNWQQQQQHYESNHPVSQWHEQLMLEMRYWCATFKYLNLEQAALSYNELGQIGLQNTYKGGLCRLARPKWAPSTLASGGGGNKSISSDEGSTPPPRKKRIRIRMDAFEFNYEKLYIRQAGIRLLGSVKRKLEESDERSSALIAPTEGQALINQQIVEPAASAADCARACFSQSRLRPWCRSFDFMETLAQPAGVAHYFCIQNSMTLGEARAAQNQILQANQTNHQGKILVTVWHFEPRKTFPLDNAATWWLEPNEQSMVEEEDQVKQDGGEWPMVASHNRLAGRALVTLVAIATGFCLSLVLYDRLRGSLEGVSLAGRLAPKSAQNDALGTMAMDQLTSRDQLEAEFVESTRD